MIQSILCEGKFDLWFFDQLAQQRGIEAFKIQSVQKKYEELVGRCIGYLKHQGDNPLIIFSDNGKPSIYNKYLSRTVKDHIGRSPDDVTIFLVVDSDYAPIDGLVQKVQSSLDTIKNTSQYMNNVKIECEGNNFIIQHPKSQYKVIVRVYTVPYSLEKQAVDYCYEAHNHKKIEDCDIHKIIRLLADEYYDSDTEKLFRDFADNAFDEEWVTLIYDNIVT